MAIMNLLYLIIANYIIIHHKLQIYDMVLIINIWIYYINIDINIWSDMWINVN